MLFDVGGKTAKKGGDYLVSTNCDATHFCNCRGNVSIENSVFENMMDDACNVHGIYLKVDEIIDKNTLLLKLRHFQQFGVNNFQKGDIVEISSPDMREFSANYTVKNAGLTEKTRLNSKLKKIFPALKKVLSPIISPLTRTFAFRVVKRATTDREVF